MGLKVVLLMHEMHHMVLTEQSGPQEIGGYLAECIDIFQRASKHHENATRLDSFRHRKHLSISGVRSKPIAERHCTWAALEGMAWNMEQPRPRYLPGPILRGGG